MFQKPLMPSLVILGLLVLLAVPTSAPFSSPLENVYTVNSPNNDHDSNPGDGVCSVSPSGVCTLPAAIDEANADQVPSRILFSVNISYYGDTLHLTENGTTIDASSRFDQNTGYPGVGLYQATGSLMLIEASNIRIYGLLFLNTGGFSSGLAVFGSNNIIGGAGLGQRNIFIISYPQSALSIFGGSGNYALGNYFGTVDGSNLYGSPPVHGCTAILLENNTSSYIDSNLIVNYEYAVRVNNGGNNSISNNTIGLDKTLNNGLGNGFGVSLAFSNNNTIGPDNVISASTANGVDLYHSTGTQIGGNFIGLIEGNNIHGIELSGLSENAVISNNYIINNGQNGLILSEESSSPAIRNNLILENGFAGIAILNTSGGTIGGTEVYRNVISLNHGNGIHLLGVSEMLIAGNLIGLEENGTLDWGNEGYGILVENNTDPVNRGSVNNQLRENWIANNSMSAIEVRGNLTHDNRITQNILGAPANWSAPAGNGWHGIALYGGTYGNTASGNTILDSGWSGVAVDSSTGNHIEDNLIGTNGTSHHWKNNFHGIHIHLGSSNEIAGNTIHANDRSGVYIDQGANNTLRRCL